MRDKITIREFLENYDNGAYESRGVQTQIRAGWFDWFCRDSSLYKRTKKLANKLKQIVKSTKFDIDKTYVFFKNNCPCYGSLYDDFRICDIETCEVLYTIIPEVGYDSLKKEYEEGKTSGLSQVWGKDNDFEDAILTGSWQEVKNFFLK